MKSETRIAAVRHYPTSARSLYPYEHKQQQVQMQIPPLRSGMTTKRLSRIFLSGMTTKESAFRGKPELPLKMAQRRWRIFTARTGLPRRRWREVRGLFQRTADKIARAQ